MVCNAVPVNSAPAVVRTRSTLSTVISESSGRGTRESVWSALDVVPRGSHAENLAAWSRAESRPKPEEVSFRTPSSGAGSSRWPRLLPRYCSGRGRHEKASCPRIRGRCQLKTLKLLRPLATSSAARRSCLAQRLPAPISPRLPIPVGGLSRMTEIASLVTPCGGRFFSIGVNGVDGGSKPRDGVRGYFWGFYEPTLSGWTHRARERLLAWGFNTAGAWSLEPQILDMPATIELSLGRRVNFMWGDPFDPDLSARVRRMAKKLIAPYKGDPRRIGYFSDNEIGWWNGPLFSAYTRYAPSNHTQATAGWPAPGAVWRGLAGVQA